MLYKIKKIKLKKELGTFITDYINYTLAKSEVPNMYSVRVGFGILA